MNMRFRLVVGLGSALKTLFEEFVQDHVGGPSAPPHDRRDRLLPLATSVLAGRSGVTRPDMSSPVLGSIRQNRPSRWVLQSLNRRPCHSICRLLTSSPRQTIAQGSARSRAPATA